MRLFTGQLHTPRGILLQRTRACLCRPGAARQAVLAHRLLAPLPPARRSDIVPLGQLKSSFNYSTSDKRVLNLENVVNDDDNIKQARAGRAWATCQGRQGVLKAGSALQPCSPGPACAPPRLLWRHAACNS